MGASDFIAHVGTHNRTRSDGLFDLLTADATQSMKRPFRSDQGYGRGGTPIFTGVLEPLARVALYPTDGDGLGTWFGAA